MMDHKAGLGYYGHEYLGYYQRPIFKLAVRERQPTPAHGTAYDIAGQGIADIGAFQAALRIAVRMALGPK